MEKMKYLSYTAHINLCFYSLLLMLLMIFQINKEHDIIMLWSMEVYVQNVGQTAVVLPQFNNLN